MRLALLLLHPLESLSCCLIDSERKASTIVDSALFLPKRLLTQFFAILGAFAGPCPACRLVGARVFLLSVGLHVAMVARRVGGVHPKIIGSLLCLICE